MNRLKELREKHSMTQEDLANRINQTKSNISKYETGRLDLNTSVIESLCNLFNVSVDYLLGRTNIPKPPEQLDDFSPRITEDYVTFPVIGEIAAGYDHIADESWPGEKIDIPLSYLKGRKPEEFFVLKVIGDSMFPTYQEDDKVLILKQATMNYSGQIGAVVYNDDCATLKRIEYRMGEDWMNLVPVNPAFPPIRVENEALEHCRVLGIPQLIVREVKN